MNHIFEMLAFFLEVVSTSDFDLISASEVAVKLDDVICLVDGFWMLVIRERPRVWS